MDNSLSVDNFMLFCSRMLLRMLGSILLILIFLFSLTFCETQEKPKEVIYSISIRALSELREIENSYMEHLTNYVSFLNQKVESLRMYI